MTPERKYATGRALRTALEERLKRIALEEGVDLQRLRRQVAFDRFLARLFPRHGADWILKGGYAMELRFQTARATRDLDFTVRAAQSVTGGGLLKQLQDAGATDAGEFFLYRIGEPTMDLDGAPYGGARYPVEAIIGGRTFVKFHLDVGIGDVVMDPPEQARMRDWLGFAGIAPPAVPMIQREQQFAEKLHAYTLPRMTPNSRVRDLVDMVLLIQSGTLESGRVVRALRATFGRRATHSVPEALIPPPGGVELTIHQARGRVQSRRFCFRSIQDHRGILRRTLRANGGRIRDTIGAIGKGDRRMRASPGRKRAAMQASVGTSTPGNASEI